MAARIYGDNVRTVQRKQTENWYYFCASFKMYFCERFYYPGYFKKKHSIKMAHIFLLQISIDTHKLECKWGEMEIYFKKKKDQLEIIEAGIY